jgi:hypothetical protein
VPCSLNALSSCSICLSVSSAAESKKIFAISSADSGENLARVEMQTAFATLARRLPGLRLAVGPDALRFKGESGIYGMKELPVTW